MRTILLFVSLLSPCLGDVYFHFPPGSNNRLNGNGVNVRNANRLFDSQNNGKAGYNVGDSLSDNPRDNIKEPRQQPLEFYMSGCDGGARSEVEVMWTNQHGTGPETDDTVETQIILQYMCQPYPAGEVKNINADFQFYTIRNGEGRNTQPFADNTAERRLIRKNLGLHEPIEFRRTYSRRNRNPGLFTANQNLQGTTTQYTRQNANGQRRGLEVPEERDYYPYWGPTPWRDIAIMVSNGATKDLMTDFINRPDYGENWLCIMAHDGNEVSCPRANSNNRPNPICVGKHITRESCLNAGGNWAKVKTNYKEKSSGDAPSKCDGVSYVKGRPYEPHKISQGTDGDENQTLVAVDSPKVVYAPSTVVNHNGMNLEGKFSSFKWKVPYFPSNEIQRCVLRIRYNITTSDVPRTFDVNDNDKVTNNPTTVAVDDSTTLQLALNTAQLGRTFQDRSYVIYLKPRPASLEKSKIYYIGVVGKRGNIVQTYPAMEYRFFPERLTVSKNDVVCFAWSGSNNNPTAYAGQGQQSSDRTNICWIEGDTVKPKKCENIDLEVVDSNMSSTELNLHLNKGCYSGNETVQAQLNNAPPSCNPPCFRIKKPGKYSYMSTRNNNFSNRRHIGQITVTD